MLKLFDKHYGTQRFFIMIFFCLAVLIAMFMYGNKLYGDAHKYQVATTALYTSELKWSKTSAACKVVSLIASKDKTKVFLLIKNEEFASFNADDYKVFFTHNDKSQERMNDPALTIYSYGASGYVGFYFTDAKGFGNQIVKLIIRNDSVAAEVANESMRDANAVRDKSFIEHNQVQIYANFGAEGIKTSSVFDDANVNQLTLFANTAGVLSDGTEILNYYNTNVRQADNTLYTMTQQKMLIDQYADNLSDMKIIVPNLPYWVINDKIDQIPNNYETEPGQFYPDMISYAGYAGAEDTFLSLSVNSEGNTDDSAGEESDNPETNEGDGEAPARPAATYIDYEGIERMYNYYHTDTILPGRIQFEYQGKLLSDGFISQTSFYKNLGTDDAIAAYDLYSDWKAEMLELYGGDIPKSVSYSSWRKVNGDYVDKANIDEWTVITKYTTALNTYIEQKAKYYEYLDNIIELEHKIYVMGQYTTINSGGPDNQNIWVYD